MKKIIKKIFTFGLAVILSGIPNLRADTTTTRLGLTKPDIGSTNWAPKLNANYDLADSGFAVLGAANTFGAFTQTFNGPISINTATAAGLAVFNSNVGAQVKLTVKNTDNTNGGSTALYEAIAGGTSGGDAFYYCGNGTTEWSWGLDQSASSAWKLSRSSALGVNDAFIVSTSNMICMGTATTPDASIPLYIKRTGAGQVLKLENSGGTVDIEFFPSGASKWRVGHGIATSGFDIRDTVNSRTSLTIDPTTSAVAILGTNTNNNATTGYVGEYVSAVAGNANTGATGVWTNITSISLTAGDWLVSGQANGGINGATATAFNIAVSINSGNTVTDQVSGDNQMTGMVPTGAQDCAITIASYRLSLSGTTTVYIKQAWTYSAGTPRTEGSRIGAVRIR